MAIVWGSVVGGSTSQMRLGVEMYHDVHNKDNVRAVAKIYLWTRYRVTDVNNTFSYSRDFGYAQKALSIKTTNTASWSTGNQVLVQVLTKYFDRKDTDYTISVFASLKGIDIVGASVLATAQGYYRIPAKDKPVPVVPSAVTGLASTRNSDMQNVITWSNNPLPVAYGSIELQRSVDNDVFQTLATLEGTATSYIDNTCEANKSYQYQVTALSADGTRAESLSSKRTYNTPSAVTGFSAGTYLESYTSKPNNAEIVELGTELQCGVGLQAQDKFYVTAPSASEVRAWNGSNLTASSPSGAEHGARAMAVMQDRLFIGGKDSLPNVVEYTAVGDFNDWANGGAIALGAKGSGERIQAFAVHRDRLIVATDQAVYGVQVSGEETEWIVKTLSTHQGCSAPRTLVANPNGVLWLGHDGVYSYGAMQGFGGDGEGVFSISTNITPTITRIKNKQIACATYYKNRYYLSVALDSDTQNTHTLVSGYVNQSTPTGGFNLQSSEIVWTLYDYGFTSFVREGEKLYAGGYDGSIYELEQGYTDNGKPIEMLYVTPQFVNSPALKDFREVTVVAHSPTKQEITLVMNTDGTEDKPTVLAYSQAENKSQRIPYRRKGYAVGVKVKATANAEPITITQMTVPFSERRS